MNNDHDIEKLFSPLSEVSLSVDEKSRLRDRLCSHVYSTQHPRVPIRSPLTALFFRTTPFIAMLLLVAITTSTVAAAEGALPGDVLYPIKIHLTEEVRALTARSPQSKAAWNIERAERRMAELETLAATDRVDDVIIATADARIEIYLAAALPPESEQVFSGADDDNVRTLRVRAETLAHATERFRNRYASAKNNPTLALMTVTTLEADHDTDSHDRGTSKKTPPRAAALMAEPFVNGDDDTGEPSLLPDDLATTIAITAAEHTASSTDPIETHALRASLIRRLDVARESITQRELQLQYRAERARKLLEEAEKDRDDADRDEREDRHDDAARKFRDAIEKTFDALDALHENEPIEDIQEDEDRTGTDEMLRQAI